jgi:hypothetical protein
MIFFTEFTRMNLFFKLNQPTTYAPLGRLNGAESHQKIPLCPCKNRHVLQQALQIYPCFEWQGYF